MEETGNKSSENESGEKEEVHMEIIIGHIKQRRTPKSDFYDWTVYVRSGEENYVTRCIKYVVFNLPKHFSNPTRVVCLPPFNISDSGRGSFRIRIDIYFATPGKQIDSRKCRFDYNLNLQNNCDKNYSRAIMQFANLSPKFREKLLKNGGKIVRLPKSRTSSNGPAQQRPSTSRAKKRKLECVRENIFPWLLSDLDCRTFGEDCSSKLQKVDEMCPTQKILAEKLINDLFYHAQLEALTSDSCVFPLKSVQEDVVTEETVEKIVHCQNPSTSSSGGGKQGPFISSENLRMNDFGLENFTGSADSFAFSFYTATKLQKIKNICPTQKSIAEKLIQDVLNHAQLKALTTETAILAVKGTAVKSERSITEEFLTIKEDASAMEERVRTAAAAVTHQKRSY